jgi:mono/diheme cytochrome c family protein
MAGSKNDPGFQPRMSEQRRAFLVYKENTKKYGKPFMPYGVWHDVVAATLVMAVILVLSCVWYAQANCDSYWNPRCDRVATPLEQEQFTPKEPGVVVKDKKGAIDESVKRPYLGLLYEEKADPSTTSYHPRPEWYFFFLFYLLVIFSNPQLVVLGTIGLPTLWLIMLIALPFVDRRRERRPSRRPVAMGAMVLVSIMLLSFTYLGSQSGKHKAGPEGITADQMALPGYAVLFEDGIFETCQSCHQLGGVGNSGPGPDLSKVGTRYDKIDDITSILAKGKGGVMPIKGGAPMTDEQAAQVAAFLATLGAPEKATEQEELNYGQKDWDRIAGGGDEDGGSTGDTDEDVASDAQNDDRAPAEGEASTGA